MTYYEILGVKQSDSIETVKKEYRARVKKNHPDVQQSEEWKEWATEYIKTLNEAYEVLSNPERRAEYDLLLSQEYTESDYDYEPAYEYAGESQGYTGNYSYKPVSPLRSFLGTFFGKALIFILIFGVGNGILYVAQGFGHANEKAQMEEIQTYLDRESVDLENMTNQLNSRSNDIDTLDASMNVWYDSDVDQYNANVDYFNSMLDEYNSLYDSCKGKLNAYNLKVDQYNALADKVGSEWYIIPVPIKSKI